MITTHEYRAIARRSAAGIFVHDRLELAQSEPRDPSWFACGVYTIGSNDIIVVNEPTTILQHAAVQQVATPSWATALIDATLLSPEGPHPPRIEIDILHPDDLDPAAAAFAAACAAWDDSFHDNNPVDALIRMRDEIRHVQAAHHPTTGTWSGVVTEATHPQRTEMARWRHYRSVNTKPGWGGWDTLRFHLSTASPYDVAGMIPFTIVPLDGLNIAVIISPLSATQTTQLGQTTMPPWIDIVATSRLLTSSDARNARIMVDELRPHDTDPTRVGVAVTTAYDLGGRFNVDLDDCAVFVDDDEVHVDLHTDTDKAAHTWTARARPLRG